MTEEEAALESKRAKARESTRLYRERHKEELKIRASSPENRAKQSQRGKKHYAQNKEKIAKRQKEHYQENREQILSSRHEYQKNYVKTVLTNGGRKHEDNKKKANDYYHNHSEEIKARRKIRRMNRTPEEKERDKAEATIKTRERLRADPAYKLLFAARKNVNLGLAGIKKRKSQSANSYLKYFGCSAEELKFYIESQFSPEMTWENHGSVWHLDHIIPLSLGRGNQELLIKLCHFRNLRPLDRAENIRKKDSIVDFWPEGVPFTRKELGL